MKIDRHNYEEFFILYMDNELNAEERQAVEAFAGQHADLKEELDMLMQSKMTPDEQLVFTDKDSLLKTEGYSAINKHNYEEWFLSYTDNELNDAQKKDVEQFIANHSSLQNELTLLLRAKLEPEAIVFPYKESLYRKEDEKVRVIFINWKRYAAAAALLLAVSATAFLALRNDQKKDQNEFAQVKENPSIVDPAKKGSTIAPSPELPVKKENADIANTDTPTITPEKSEVTVPAINSKDKKLERVPSLRSKSVQKTNEMAVNAPQKTQKKQNNNLPQPKYNPNVNSIDNPIKTQDNVLAMNDASNSNKALTEQSQKLIPSNVTPATDQSFIQAKNTTATDVVVNEPGGNKNKLRGFFRKLTRTFEKNTNIKATDEEDRLLVGGLAIRL